MILWLFFWTLFKPFHVFFFFLFQQITTILERDGTSLGINIAGGLGTTTFQEDEEVCLTLTNQIAGFFSRLPITSLVFFSLTNQIAGFFLINQYNSTITNKLI